MIKIEIITIGDEILYGQIIDTNAAWMSAYLDDHGIKTVHRTTIGDKEDDIINALQLAEKRANVILITGGLGPTKDDKTKETLTKYFNSKLVKNEEAFYHLKRLFEAKGYEMTPTNEQQAYLPLACEIMINKHGTAPGMWFEKNDVYYASMPGVPFEMKELMKDEVVPRILKNLETINQIHQFVHTIGIGESWLSDIIADWEEALPNDISLAYLPSLGQVKLRLSIASKEPKTVLKKKLETQVTKLKPLIKQYVYSYEKTTLEQKIGSILVQQGKTIGTAESCTGGYIGTLITSHAGSSAYFNGSIIAYSNEVKIKTLNVDRQYIIDHGAVSEQVVSQMAVNCLDTLDVDYGIATSGVAGPSGGTKQKPVGHIWIAVARKTEAGKTKVQSKLLQLGLVREANIKRTTTYAFLLLWKMLTNRDD